MAHLVRQKITYYVNAKGKRVPKGTPGAKKVRGRASKWYGTGVPGYPPKKRIPLATDKTAAQRMLDDLVRDAERGQAKLPDRDATRLPLTDHLKGFESDLSLGLTASGGKRRKAPSTAQVKLTVQRVRDVLDGCQFAYPADFNADAPGKLSKYLHDRLGRKKKDGGFSAQSAAFYLAAARRFARWLSSQRMSVRADLFDGLPGFDPRHNREHERREVSPDEMARLIDTTRASSKEIRNLAGPDRAMLYLVAFATGYRASELAMLRPENFDLDAEVPMAILPAKDTKNKKPAMQPLPPGVAFQLREYLASKPKRTPVWPGTWSERPVSVLRRDLAAAKVPYCIETIHGKRYADFHALRHSYLSALSAAGVGVKELQELARHGDVRLTLGIYTHARNESLGASVARLQIPGAGQENPLASLSRADLETAVITLIAVARALSGGNRAALTPALTPPLTPNSEISGDGPRPPETGSGPDSSVA